MYDWIIKHKKECEIDDPDKCTGCLHVSEAQWDLTEAQEEMDQKKNQPKPEPQPKPKPKWNYKLGRYM